jgi:hypothetical protein
MHLEAMAMLLDFNNRRRLFSPNNSRPVDQTFLFANSALAFFINPVNSMWREQVCDCFNNQPAQCIRSSGQALQNDKAIIPVNDKPRQKVAFAIHQAVARCIGGNECLTECQGTFQAATNKSWCNINRLG